MIKEELMYLTDYKCNNWETILECSRIFTTFCWYLLRDSCIQFLLDNVMKAALRIDGGLAVVQNQLMDAYTVSTTF